MPTLTRPQKIAFAEMCEQGVRGILIYCQDFHCSHSVATIADRWPDDLRLSDIEDRFTCTACGKRGANVRPDFNWDRVKAHQRPCPVRRSPTCTTIMGFAAFRCPN